MNTNAIARDLVAAMTDAVQRHVHPRTGLWMPPRLTGRLPVAGVGVGEKVLDRADELLAAESWLQGQDPDVSFELCKVAEGWVISWSIGEPAENSGDGPADESDGDDTMGESK
jgi:hypothetical protein